MRVAPMELLVLGALALVAGCSTATREVHSPAGRPFQASCEVLDRNTGACIVTTVPAGQRLVIEMVSGRMGRFRGGEPVAGPTIRTIVGGSAQRHWLTREFLGTNATLNLDVYVVTHHLRLYADPGTPVTVETPDAVGGFTISGFLVPLP